MVDFKGNQIFLDTSPFIYYLEGSSHFHSVLSSLFVSNNKGEFKIITSVLTLSEVLVIPYKNKDDQLVHEYKELLKYSTHLELVSIDDGITERAANLRANFTLKAPDAIQLATAIDQECDYFLTHDLRLQKITEIKILTLDQL